MQNPLRGTLRCVTLSLALLALPSAARADNETYVINQVIGNGSVTGEVVTNGVSGALTEADVVSWNLLLKGGSASTSLTPSNSNFHIGGKDLTGNAAGLYFNFSGTDGGYMLVQTNLFSGTQYWCNNTSYFACNPGASVTPKSVYDPSFQSVPESGNQLLGKAMSVIPLGQLTGSVGQLANSHTGQMISNQTQTTTILSGQEQVSCGNCGGAGMTVGSFAINSHGRVRLTPGLTMLLGGAIGEYQHRDAHVTLDIAGAMALRLDPTNMGKSRPFAEIGGSFTYDEASYTRSYVTNNGLGTSTSRTHGTDTSAYVRLGWVDRLSKRDEFAMSAHLTGVWQHVGGYAELSDSTNPFHATMPAGTDRMTIAGIGAQMTHLFGRSIEAELNGGVERAFNGKSGITAQISNLVITPVQPALTYYAVGGRIGVRLRRHVTLDLFVNSAIAPKAIGTDTHGGGMLRITW